MTLAWVDAAVSGALLMDVFCRSNGMRVMLVLVSLFWGDSCWVAQGFLGNSATARHSAQSRHGTSGTLTGKDYARHMLRLSSPGGLWRLVDVTPKVFCPRCIPQLIWRNWLCTGQPSQPRLGQHPHAGACMPSASLFSEGYLPTAACSGTATTPRPLTDLSRLASIRD